MKFVLHIDATYEVEDENVKQSYGTDVPWECLAIDRENLDEYGFDFVDIVGATITNMDLSITDNESDPAKASMELQKLLLDNGAEIREVTDGAH